MGLKAGRLKLLSHTNIAAEIHILIGAAASQLCVEFLALLAAWDLVSTGSGLGPKALELLVA